MFGPNLTDFYKVGHPFVLPKGTEELYGNFTPRGDKLARVLPDFDHKVVWFGIQGVLQHLLIEVWNETFFSQPKEQVIARYKRRMDRALGEGAVPVDKMAALHDLGYLPVSIKALPEGSRVNMRVPLYTIKSTHEDFAWVEQYLETQMSAELWKMITSATTAHEYRRLFLKYAKETGVDPAFVDFQGHDFSMRGMSGVWDASTSGAGHLLSFKGTDTISAIDYLEDYYPDPTDPFIGGSVSATEHAVSSSNIINISASLKEHGSWNGWSTADLTPTREGDIPLLEIAETGFLKYMLHSKPTGIFSYVADTFSFFAVISNIATHLKADIMVRDGKTVFRPDSGNPVDILCGIHVEDMSKRKDLEEAKLYMMDFICDEVRRDTPFAECGDSEATGYFRFADKVYKLVAEIDWDRYDKQYYYMDGNDVKSCEEITLTAEQKGAVETLWDIFGGTVTDKSFKTLDSHVGLIYGDSITLERAQEILKRLKAKGFSSANVVYGIGSFTYQFCTRDTFGTAIKATFAKIDGVDHELFKDPKTDNGIKKSARGLLRVEYEDGNFVLYDQQTREQEVGGLLREIFRDSKMTHMDTLTDVRQRLLLSDWPQPVDSPEAPEAVTA
jgi:nicotinamide phosphoribosyltransferase